MSGLKHSLMFALAMILSSQAMSQQSPHWPEHTVRLVTSSTPGGSADIAARLFAEKLSTLWKANVIVENRPGADGIIAIQAVLASSDGHTLLAAPSSNVTVTPVIRKVPYQQDDLRPLSTIAVDFLAVAVPAASQVRSLADLIVAARATPGALNWFGVSGSPSMAFGEFIRVNHLDMVYVPYKGSLDALRDLSESRIHIAVIPLATALPLAQGGRLRLIAVTSPEAAPTAPDVPTALAAGHPELAIQGVLGLFAPKSIPEVVQQRISADIQSIANDPEIRDRLEKTGMIAKGSTSGDYARYLDEQLQHWGQVARSQKIEPTN